jgi:asparagine synthase (glutamine-hydrolysing)
MCGIAGLLRLPVGADLAHMARRMADMLVHRGPDDHGIWIDDTHGLALAHRRLAIVDLTPHGHQPMHSVSGRYVMIFNGEVYNHARLRSEMDASGQAPAWRGHSDTEVLLAALEAWGLAETLRRSVGMFAIAVWDREEARLHLARDRMGEKPLYYGKTAAGFAFASELKALRALDAGRPTLDRVALADYMQFGYVRAPRTVYSGWFKLPPGHVICIERTGRPAAAPQPYWSPATSADRDLRVQLANSDETTAVDMLQDRLKDAIGLQMMADVPLGAFLSGGVDSSTVVALMQLQSQRPVRTYTIGFHERAFDEAPFARAVAQHLGTEHTELYVSADDAKAVIPDLPAIYDEPFADSSQVPTTLVSRLTRQHVTVALSGDGGDELFAGYPRYAIAQSLWQRLRRVPRPLRQGTAAALQAASPQTWDSLISALPALKARNINGRRVHRLGRVLAARHAGELYERLLAMWQPEDQLVLGVAPQAPGADPWPEDGQLIERMRRWDVQHYLPDDLLVKVDRAAMSTSLETRAPLLDHRVVELAFAMPPHLLVRAGQGKWVLRQLLDRHVPRSLIERPKAGFSIPLAEWLRGPLRAWAQDLLSPALLRSEGLLNEARITAIWNEHLSGRYDRSSYLWAVLMFQAWHQQVRQGSGTLDPVA